MVVEAPPSRLTAQTAPNDRMSLANSRRVIPTAVPRRPSAVTNRADPSEVRPTPVRGWRSGNPLRVEGMIRPSSTSMGGWGGGVTK